MKYLGLALLILAICCVSVQAADVILITDKDNPVSSLSEKDVKQIFLGKKTSWDDGSTIIAFTQTNPQVTELFAQKYLRKSFQQFNLYWKKAIFTGKGTPLHELSDSTKMKQFIAAQNGSLGYILDSELDETVKKIEIN